MGAAIGAPRTEATGPANPSSFVPITPCRLMDTRAGSPVGPRNTPIGAGETYSALVWGSNGNCTIPATATAISLNVTFVAPTSSGFVTVYPPDQPWPGTSNLNFTAGHAPAPNGVTSPLSFDGKIGFFNAAGTVNLIADIVGYYERSGSPDADVELGACSAQLRWDLDVCKPISYATSVNPAGVAFDGVNLWVAGQAADRVSRINPVTGSKVDFKVGHAPTGVAFDGISVWVTNTGSDTVSRVQSQTGKRTDFATGDGPTGIAFDGTSVWVTNKLADSVSRINPATGAATTFATGDAPSGIAFDGVSIWIANSGGNTVSKLNRTTGVDAGPYPADLEPTGVAFDGTSIWVSNYGGASVSKFNQSTGARTDFTVDSGPTGVAFDGTNVWVTASLDGEVATVNPTSGAVRLYAAGVVPTGLAFDGTNMWVTDNSGDRILRLVAGRGVQDISPVGSGDSSTFVPITPCRLMDTRAGAQVGPRGTAITAGETYSAAVWGSNGNCSIPTTATAVSLNVTFVGPTSSGFVTVYPPDQPWPGTSNLNFSAGQAPAPNGVTSPLSFDGKIGFFNAVGSVNLIADIVGYYENAGSAPGALVIGNCGSLLRWDLPGCHLANYATGNNPSGIAFDGTNLWITNEQDNTVSKFNPTTGTKVDFPTGTTPTAVAFDGANIWVANIDSDNLSKFNPATGARTNFAIGDSPTGVAFDGTSLWVVLQNTDQAVKVNIGSGAVEATYTTGDQPTGIAFDGTSLWIANYNASNVSKMNPADGTKVDYPLTGQFNPVGVAFDGSRIWVTNTGSNSVSRIDPTNGSSSTHTVGSSPRGIAFDGTNIWVANSGSGSVSKVNTSDGSRVDYATGDGANGVVFDGGNIWVTNTIGKTVTKIAPSGSGMRLSAVTSEGASVFVPVTPCRLMDTRAGSQVGPRGTPIGAGELYSPTVWGSNGNCIIPATAIAVSLNVTFVGPTSTGFVTVYPPDKPWPGTSNLNFVAGQAPAPNGVTSPLSADGKIGFFNVAGTVNLIADIVGYYTPVEVVTTRCLPILRWDLNACRPASIGTGDYPQGIASDGTYLWVANFLVDTVSKIDPLTGSSTEFPTGDGPFEVAFDGTNIWVTNASENTVSKINPADGSTIATFGTGTDPEGIAFDGTSIWVANHIDNSVSKINPVTGSEVPIPTGTLSGAFGVVFDGRNIWVTNSNIDTVSKIDPASEMVVGTYPTGDYPAGIAFDGTNLWIANYGNGSDSVMRMNPQTGTTTEYPIGDGLFDFAFDGTSMWVTSQNTSSVVRIDVTTGIATHVTTSSHLVAIAFDGESLWITRYLQDKVERVII